MAKKLRKILIYSQFLLLICFLSQAQSISRSVIAIAGTSYDPDNYYFSQTIGEAVISTKFSNYHFLTQGFQQPNLINKFPPSPNDNLDAIDVYPNPVRDELTISFRIVDLKKYHVKIYDLRGRLIMEKTYDSMMSGDEKFDLSRYRQGLYLIHVYSDNLKINRLFKIEKL